MRVCKTVVLKIISLSRDRIERVVKNFVLKGQMPQENRGGDRILDKNDNKKLAIKLGIEYLQCVQSHYCRSQTSTRVYLRCELNIKKTLEYLSISTNCELNWGFSGRT